MPLRVATLGWVVSTVKDHDNAPTIPALCCTDAETECEPSARDEDGVKLMKVEPTTGLTLCPSNTSVPVAGFIPESESLRLIVITGVALFV
jgi:hypothetical protein